MATRIEGPFGDYQVEELLSEGAIADMYRARHPEHGTVGLKVLHQDLTENEEILHRFWREMRLPEKLDHPNIARVLDAGVVGDHCYLALEWLPGRTLRTLIEDNQSLPPEEAAWLVEAALDGLHHAHQAGMVHRNLKPEHVVLDEQGAPHLLEFALAKHLDGTVALTRTDEVFGTPWYMAPEQIRSTAEVGMAADVYAMGVILYELVTGVLPFDGRDAMDVAHQQVKGVPWAPSAQVGGIPREYELVILKALEKNPSDRFSSAASMKKALEYARTGKKTGIQLVSPVEWPSRRPWGLLAAGLLLLVAAMWVGRSGPLVAWLAPAPTPMASAVVPAGTAAPAARDAVTVMLAEYRDLAGADSAGFLELHRDAVAALSEADRRRLAAGLRTLAEGQLAGGRVAEALLALRTAAKVYESPEVHRSLARALRRAGDASRAAWHEKQASRLATGS